MKNKPYLHKDFIDRRALDIVEALQGKSYVTYLVGGCVRDLLIGIQPKDYDIGTKAHPSQVKRTVPNSYIIGKRFRLVLAKRQEDLFEIATFRRPVATEDVSEEFPNDDNAYGTPEEDAKRRDFTINGLFYDPFDEQVFDYNDGLGDLKSGLIRMIGDPETRLLEDPVRTLRAIRLAHKIQFSICPELRAAIKKTAPSQVEGALPRRREEFLKFLRIEDPSKPFLEAFDLDVFKYIAPTLHELMSDPQKARSFIYQLRNYDDFQGDKSNNTLLFSGLIHAFYRAEIQPQLEKVSMSKDLKEHPKLKTLMRDELGMFNYEQDRCIKAISMARTLKNWEEYERKGERRRKAVFHNEAFPLALLFADRDGQLTSEAWEFWLDGYESAIPSLVEGDLSKNKTQIKKKRRKRPRRRPRGPG